MSLTDIGMTYENFHPNRIDVSVFFCGISYMQDGALALAMLVEAKLSPIQVVIVNAESSYDGKVDTYSGQGGECDCGFLYFRSNEDTAQTVEDIKTALISARLPVPSNHWLNDRDQYSKIQFTIKVNDEEVYCHEQYAHIE